MFKLRILSILKKISAFHETGIDSQKQRIALLERNNLEQEKKDMWDD